MLTMIKPGLNASGTRDKEARMLEKENSNDPEAVRASGAKAEGSKDRSKNCEEVQKFSMIFNKYHNSSSNGSSGCKLNTRKDDSNEKFGSKYTMIFNKDVKVRETSKKGEETEPRLRAELNSMKLNDAETLMNLYGRSNLFIPELTITSLERDENNNLKPNDSLTSLSKIGECRALKSKIASMTCLETCAGREARRKSAPSVQDRKLSRVRSLDLCKSPSSSESDSERALSLGNGGSADSGESDKKSRGDAQRKRDKDARKQVQWKSEVDVIYFESHQAADGDRSGEIFGRVVEPLKEEWEQQRTGFYAKMVPLPFGNHLNERWQSLLKI